MSTQQNTTPINHPLSLQRLQDYGVFHQEELEYYRQKYHLKDITVEEAQQLGFTNVSEGIYIEYPHSQNSRIRYNRTGFQAQQDLGKYGQRPGTKPAVYMPPTITQVHLNNQEIPILIIEGEFKAIVVDHVMNNGQSIPSLVPLAIGGVWSWMSSKLGEEILPAFDCIHKGRIVYIAFDMDNPVNPQVQKALQRLVDKLVEKTTRIRVLSWPSTMGKGLDDYLAGRPGPRDMLLRCLADAQAPGHIAKVLEMNASYVYDKAQDMVWDHNMHGYVKPSSFKTHYLTETVTIQSMKNGKSVNKTSTLGDYWLSSPARANCDGKTFAPGAENLVPKHNNLDVKQINTWTRWGAGSDLRNLVPQKGDVTPFLEWLRATFEDNPLIPEAPRVDIVDYLIKRIAWMFQHSTSKHPTWIYLIGKPYQGKSKLINILARLIGNTYTSHIDEDALSSNFNEWRAEKLLIAFDDVAIVEKNRIKQILKRMTTEQTARVNRKYEHEYTAYSYETFFFATNSLDPLLDHDDRRAIVLEARCPWSKEEWAKFDKWAGTPASYNALLHYFLFEVTIDSEFFITQPPRTMMRELVTETGETGWDEFLNMLAAPLPLQWQAPASKQERKYRPTIVTPEMLKALYAILQGPQDSKTEIKIPKLASKLSRFGASRIHPRGSMDSKSRIYYGGVQTTAWTWDSKYATLTSPEIMAHLDEVAKQYPELFSRYQSPISKF